MNVKKVFYSLIILIFCLSAVVMAKEIIRTESGPVSGMMEDNVRMYLGIPFAAPPMGDLRWKAPQKAAPWKNVRECGEYGPACPQPGASYKTGATDEDCLYLNIWAPKKKVGERLPVMFFLHGGGFSTGSGGRDEYNGKNLARKGVIVAVANYRLGPFGFLVHPLLTSESSGGVPGNYGLLDQIAALKWVKNNIEFFGGNSYNITIFGEGSGAASVTNLILNPIAKELFDRAIVQNGTVFANKYTLPNADGSLDQAMQTGEKFAAALGCGASAEELSCMRSRTSEELLRVKSLQFGPVIGGESYPPDIKMLFESGKINDVPLLIGFNAGEGAKFTQNASLSEYKSWVRVFCRGQEEKALALFPVTKEKNVAKVFGRLFTVLAFAGPSKFVARSMAEKNPNVYFYHFVKGHGTKKNKKSRKSTITQGSEIPYVFGNLDMVEGYDADDFDLSEKMMNYWVNFAYSGDPNTPNLLPWPKYSKDGGQYMEFADRISVKFGLYKEYEDLMENIE